MLNFLELTSEKIMALTSDQPSLLVEHWSKQSVLAERHFSVAPGAEINYLLIIDQDIDSEVINRSWSIAGQAQVNLYYLFLRPLKAAIKLNHDIAEGANLRSHSLVLSQGQADWQIQADYNFQGRGSFARVKVEASLRERAKLRYDANMNVLAAAQKSDTRVDMRLYLEDEARGQVIPGLNIAANDVKAGHSASTFRLAPADLFYLRSRGLSVGDIKKMLSLSLANNFLQAFPDADLKAEVLALIAENL